MFLKCEYCRADIPQNPHANRVYIQWGVCELCWDGGRVGVSTKVGEIEWSHFRPLCRACGKRPVQNGKRYCHPCDSEIREMVDDHP